jgi:RimJ/RimL family protein N-acetyltransferase
MNIGFRFLDGMNDWGWINEQTNILRVEDTTGIVAVNSDTGELLAACVMDNWHRNAVNCHFIVKNPVVIRHGFLKKIVEYVFVTRDKRIIIGQVAESNKKAVRLNKHFGFTVKTRFDDVFIDGSGMVIMELTREHALKHPHLKRLGEK